MTISNRVLEICILFRIEGFSEEGAFWRLIWSFPEPYRFSRYSFKIFIFTISLLKQKYFFLREVVIQSMNPGGRPVVLLNSTLFQICDLWQMELTCNDSYSSILYDD